MMNWEALEAEKGNYIRELRKVAIVPGRLHLLKVLHDDWCALLAGNGACDCDPEIVVRIVEPEEESWKN